MGKIRNFLAEATAIEYGLIAALIAVAAISAFQADKITEAATLPQEQTIILPEGCEGRTITHRDGRLDLESMAIRCKNGSILTLADGDTTIRVTPPKKK